METLGKLRRIVYGEPLSDQAIAELDEAKRQVEQALAAFDRSLGNVPSTMEVQNLLNLAKAQLANARDSFQSARNLGYAASVKGSPAFKDYERHAELGAHRIREAITNLKDALRMLGAPE